MELEFRVERLHNRGQQAKLYLWISLVKSFPTVYVFHESAFKPVRFCPGPASAPGLTIIPGGLTSLIVHMTTPSTNAICVDNYTVTLAEQGVAEEPMRREKVVSDATQNLYRFEFPGIDLCREMLPSYTATAVAVTNGTEGSKAMIATSVNVDKTSKNV